MNTLLAGALAALLPLGTLAQNVMPNPSFETGTSTPASWQLTGSGTWESFGHTGAHSVSVAATAGGGHLWRSYNCPVEQGKAYVVRFWTCATNYYNGWCSGGFSTAARDFPRPGNHWTDFQFAAWIPSLGAPDFRLGTWDGPGSVYFDDVEILPLNPVHERVGPYTLGVGETLAAGRYVFQTAYGTWTDGSPIGNYSRPLYQANAIFSTYRWMMYPNYSVVYHHELAGQTFSNAQVSCAIINHYNSLDPTVLFEASTNAQTWQFVGAMQGTNTNSVTFSLPANLSWATNLFVRLRSTNSSFFSISSYSFAANVTDAATAGVGATHCFGQFLASPDVQISRVSSTETGKVVTLLICNTNAAPQEFAVSARTEFAGNVRSRLATALVAPGQTNLVEVLLPTAGFGDNTCLLTVSNQLGALVSQHSLRFAVSILADDSYGEALPAPAECPVWWCDGAYKVGRTRLPPIATNTSVRISAARNEYEPFQLVLRPETAMQDVTVSVGDFVCRSNPSAVISATNLSVSLVEYVPVTMVIFNEKFSVAGDHPDPLPTLTLPFNAAAGTNTPLWFTVHVPKTAAAGEYDATITVSSASTSFSLPVCLRVYGFTLTDVTHTRTFYAVGKEAVELWHGLGAASLDQKNQVWNLYMQNMARHRLTANFPQDYAPVLWNYNPANSSFSYDFTRFDEAMADYLDELDMTSFKDLNFYREFPPIGGIARYNASSTGINPAYRPLYTRLIQGVAQHFRERGWLEKAYCFWIDEPKFEQTSLTQDGNLMVEEAAPDLRRLLTEFNGPSPDLNASIWMPQLTGVNLNAVTNRKAAGDEVWFYIATGPKAPVPNNFIDHPAVNPRIRSWYAEQMGLQGEGYYSINYYLGITNPWYQAMSMTAQQAVFTNYFTNLNTVYTTYETNHYTNFWGNGDGNLVYPPVKQVPASPLISGPVDSIRWEMLREGAEDREYFWLLDRLVKSATPVLGTNHPAVVEAVAARDSAFAVLSSPFCYPYEPHQLMAARNRLAEAIEALDEGIPFIAKGPLSKVVTVGQSETLRAEAVGWPVPAIQWVHNGTNLPGATDAKLVLAGITTNMAGEYRVIASNSAGSVTSAVGRLTVLITNQPPVLIAQPASLTRTNGGRAVFGAGASSLMPVTYQWLRDGVPIMGATNVTLLLTNLNLASGGFYSVVVSNGFGATTSAPAPLHIQMPGGAMAPLIASQPTNLTVTAGRDAQFAVAASGTDPLSYQWYFNTTNVLAGANGNIFALTNVQPSKGGTYTVTISNLAGAITSAPAILTVETVGGLLPPDITSQPANLTVLAGQNAQFAVSANGTEPLNYQWYFNETNVLAGEIGSVLMLTNVQPSQAGTYLVVITNDAGTMPSTAALLQVLVLPNYTFEPPGLAGDRHGTNLVLLLTPDNRTRKVLVSSNLLDWDEFYSAAPSATQALISVSTTNLPGRFFRVLVVP